MDPEHWDPISHRDVITGNILLHKEEGSCNAYPIVKLADFGCATTLREVSQNNLKPKGMPEECPSVVPPEGPVASEDADVYQIGNVGNRLMGSEDEEGKKHTARFYNKALKVFADKCVVGDPEERPSAAHMLNEFLVMKRLLVRRRYLRFQELIW
jgi:serine/threonine protein kinase